MQKEKRGWGERVRVEGWAVNLRICRFGSRDSYGEVGSRFMCVLYHQCRRKRGGGVGIRDEGRG